MWLNFTRTCRLLLVTTVLLSGCAVAPAPQQGSAHPTRNNTVSQDTGVDVEAAFQAAIQHMQNEDWHAAADQLQAITVQDPQLPGAWVNLGIAHVQLGDATAAETDFQQALELDPQHAEAWIQLGMLYRRSNRLEDARAAWQEVLKYQPDHVNANWNLAVLHDRYLPDPAQALTHYTRYQQLSGSTDPLLGQWIAALQQQLPEPVKLTAGVSK
jgi:Tfp pilus assembly protein PilF